MQTITAHRIDVRNGLNTQNVDTTSRQRNRMESVVCVTSAPSRSDSGIGGTLPVGEPLGAARVQGIEVTFVADEHPVSLTCRLRQSTVSCAGTCLS
jgi:hypothetical protein